MPELRKKQKRKKKVRGHKQRCVLTATLFEFNLDNLEVFFSLIKVMLKKGCWRQEFDFYVPRLRKYDFNSFFKQFHQNCEGPEILYHFDRRPGRENVQKYPPGNFEPQDPTYRQCCLAMVLPPILPQAHHVGRPASWFSAKVPTRTREAWILLSHGPQCHVLCVKSI